MATPTEASQQLDIPPATLRRYVSLFGDYLSPEATLPRGRQFNDADLMILGRIRTLLSDGGSVEEVHATLGVGSGPPRPATSPRVPAAGNDASAPSDDLGESGGATPAEDDDSPSSAAMDTPLASPVDDATEDPGGFSVAPPAALDEGADVDETGEDSEEPEEPAVVERPNWRSFPKVQPVRSSREVRKMAAELAGTDHFSQRLALAEDRVMSTNERMAVLESRITRLEEWLRMPWYRRLFAKPPDYGL